MSDKRLRHGGSGYETSWVVTRVAVGRLGVPGADTGFCVGGGAYRDGNGGVPSELARMSGPESAVSTIISAPKP